MKVNQSFIINTLTDKITMIEKERFVKNLAGEVAKKRNKLIEVKEISIMNKMSYAELVEKYKDGLTKLSKGIYYIKLDKENILVCLVDNNLEDFNKLYSKIKDSKDSKDNKDVVSNIDDEEINIIEIGREIEVKREEVKRVISRAILVGIAAVMSMSLFACKPKEKVEKIEIPLEQSVNSNETKAQETTKQITITPEEAARGKTIENTKRTVNEYGNTIYGRKLDKSEPIYSKISKNEAKGFTYTYTEYYSDAYGGIVYIKTTDKSGGIVIYNNNGQKFLAGDKPQNDIEVGLANYRMGNAMAEAIDRSVNKNK